MIDYATYSIENDLYAAFAASAEFDASLAKIKTRKVREAIAKFGIGDCIAPNGEYDFEAGKLLSGVDFSADDMSSAAYDAVCALAEAYADFVVRHHRNPRNAGRTPTTDSGRSKVRTTVSIDPELRDRAKNQGVNLSQELEIRLREILD